MSNELVYLFLFIIGFTEEFVAIVYYGFIRRGWKFPCAIMSMIRNTIWLLASAGIFASFLNPNTIQENVIESVIRGSIHTFGVGFGNYLSIYCEKSIHENILKLQRKGKRKKWWFFRGEKK